MKKKILLTHLILFMGFLSNAQDVTEKKKNIEVAFTTMLKPNLVTPSLSGVKYFSLSNKKDTRFKIGAGVRFSQILANSRVIYITAPAKLTQGSLIKKQVLDKIDTFGLSNSSVSTLNLMVALNYRITKKLNIEFSIDAFGLSLGAKQKVFLRDQDLKDRSDVLNTAKPSFLNVLLIGDNDLGSLNSEIVASYKWNDNWKFKMGLGFLFTEYTMSSKTYVNFDNVIVENDRIRNKSLGCNIGFSRLF